jgi:hypothetical protein
MNAPLVKNARARGESLLKHIGERRADIARSFYDIGSALRELNDKKLYASLGHASFDAMLEMRGLMTPQYARRLIEVVRSFDLAQAKRLGPEKAYALARYAARTKQEDKPTAYIAHGFPVGGRRRAIDDVTVREIHTATRLALLRQRGGHGENERARRDAESAARTISARLHARTDGQGEVRHVFRKGSWWLEIVLPAEMAPVVRFS